MLHTGVKDDRTMAERPRQGPDQIIRKLADGNKLVAGGAELHEPCSGPSRYSFTA